MIELICPQCGKKHQVANEDYAYKCRRNQTNFYCSKECYDKQHITKRKVRCTNCQKLFYVTKWRIDKTKKFYCSFECRDLKKQIKCDWCGILFYKKRTVIKKHNFCNRECMGRWQSQNIRGNASPSWKGGWKGYYGPNWKEQKQKARQRDKYKCQLCGISEQEKAFDVHHKIPFRIYGKERYQEANKLENLITLCSHCHNKIESHRKRKSELNG